MLTLIASIVLVSAALLPATAELVRMVEDRRRGETLLGRHGMSRRSLRQRRSLPSASMSASVSFC
jgi:hypothetical protein